MTSTNEHVAHCPSDMQPSCSSLQVFLLLLPSVILYQQHQVGADNGAGYVVLAQQAGLSWGNPCSEQGGSGCPCPQDVAALPQAALEQFRVPVRVGGGQRWSWDMDLDKFVSVVRVSQLGISQRCGTAQGGLLQLLHCPCGLLCWCCQPNSLWHKPNPPTPK